MNSLRRYKAWVALVTQSAILFASFPARAGTAEERVDSAPASAGPPVVAGAATGSSEAPSVSVGHRVSEAPHPKADALPRKDEELAPPSDTGALPPTATPQSLPSGADKTGVSSQAISVPQGAGKIQGMGESFSMQLSTGVGTFSVPFALPAARGGVSPSLSLAYSSAGGHGLAGVGWDLGVASISRQTDRGIPSYDDPPNGGAWKPTQDRFIFNGGQELVPICLVSGSSCDHALAGETMPAWSNGWQYFRPRVEGGFLRFFWSPDHRTWRAQSKSGESLELGAPLDGSISPGAVEADPGLPSRIFRWNLSRQYDAQGAANPSGSGPVNPVNVIVYRYTVDGANSYLADIYDTPPAANPVGAALTSYAHHARLRYEWRPDTTTSYRRGWAVRQALRLVGIDIASKTFQGGTASPRKVVRRYRLGYDSNFHASFLGSIQLEGRCGTGGEESEPIAEDGSESFPTTSCPALPAITFGYTHVTPYATDGTPAHADIAGFEGFDARVTSMAKSPPHSLDEEMTDLFDVNADGLPDVVVTSPGDYNGKHGLYLSGAGGQSNEFGSGVIGVDGVLGETASTITLRNANLSPGDLDGDGIIDLVHMPQVKSYSVYTPQQGVSGWMWTGRAIATAAAQSPKIDFGRDATDVQRMDVNGDGLVDVVVSKGTELDTFYSLGKFPGGDGQFGHATWTGPTSATISNDPIATCVPFAGTPVRFSDTDIKLGDMNGDGLPDIVKMVQGDIRYWPGRGNGVWGTGDTSSCVAGTFGGGREVAMVTSPQYSDPNASDLRLDDVNGDGLDDLVQVRQNDVDVWLNVDGGSWTPRHTISGTPAAPSFQHRVRLVDMNGSGTRDILWGDGHQYRFIDLSGGARPGLLTHVANGLGKTSDIEYASSTSLMLAAALDGSPWSSKMPTPVHVVTRVTDRDNLEVIGRPAGRYVTEYTYRDPVYDGRQREFRGFRSARASRLGDANSPTSSNDSTFLLGDCIDEPNPAAQPSPCTFEGRWRDNPREPLKGLLVTAETSDESGVYSTATHHTYRLRVLYSGLDGREVRHAFESQSDTWNYDTSAFDGKTSTALINEVELEPAAPPLSSRWDANSPGVPFQTQTKVTLRSTAGRAHLHGAQQVDATGNRVLSLDDGCVDCGVAGDRITLSTIFGLPANDRSGWAWRPFEEYTLGNGEALGRNHTKRSYDEFANLVQSNETLQGSLSLDRFHEPSAIGSTAVAPPPVDRSVDGEIVESIFHRNEFGQVVESQGANHRCRSLGYDPVYSELVTSESVAVGPLDGAGVCGQRPLESSALYDRGFGVPQLIKDIHLETSTIEYDGFARIVAIAKPDPELGLPSARPSMIAEYLIAKDPALEPFVIVHVSAQDGAHPTDDVYHESWAYSDGLGRVMLTLTEGDVARGDGGPWIVNGLTSYDAKGAPERAYLAWFYDGDPARHPLAGVPTTPYSRQRYDAFGRVLETFGFDGAESARRAYHALSVDAWDAADLAPGPHQGTYASEIKDGHNRVVATIERTHVGGVIESRETHIQYTSTGEPTVIARVRPSRADPQVVRWMKYDTLGRLVLNVEPNASTAFTGPLVGDAGDIPASLKAWRYVYNDSGDLVGTSDARGCGVNYHYDAGGRVVGEDYSPCLDSQPDYTQADPVTGDRFEVLNVYDQRDPDADSILDFPINAAFLPGRLSSVADRGSKVIMRYDGRGRVTGVARRLARPDSAKSLPIDYAPRWYAQTVDFDGADRPVTSTAGVVEPSLQKHEITSSVSTTYTRRGLVSRVDSDHGALVSHAVHDADGLTLQLTYADAAQTTTGFSYDARRRLKSVQTYRGPPPIWSGSGVPSGGQSSRQLLLEDLELSYDSADNPVELRDWRNPDEWPSGAKPVTKKVQYDDLYRVARIDYERPGGADSWISPFEAEDQGRPAASARARPSPHVAFDKRVQWQTFSYDWLGNTASTGDDANGFYDRSLGAITNGGADRGPYQLSSASSTTSTSAGTSREGALSADYDAAGNMIDLAVRRDGPCLPNLPVVSICSQRFVYDWDEVNRLSRARRWDVEQPGGVHDSAPSTPAVVDLRYAYDATDDRVLKTAVAADGAAVYTAYPLDAFELHRTVWDSEAGDYARSVRSQVAYLFSNGIRLGRVVDGVEDLPSATSGTEHVFLELMDHLGSTSIVVDRDTSELVEESSYQGYGGPDGDYRPERWGAFREDYRFTGKEEDVEVGLQYFGKRYYVPGLGRWLSADPLNIHALGADLNVYAYVHGKVLAATDPTGLGEPALEIAEAAAKPALRLIEGGKSAPSAPPTNISGAGPAILVALAFYLLVDCFPKIGPVPPGWKPENPGKPGALSHPILRHDQGLQAPSVNDWKRNFEVWGGKKTTPTPTPSTGTPGSQPAPAAPVTAAGKCGGISGTFKEVEIIDAGRNPIGEFDGVEPGKITEHKQGLGAGKINPKTGVPWNTVESFAQDQIFNKTVTKIENLGKAVATRPTKNGSPEVPCLQDLQSIRHIEFQVEADTPEIRTAVEDQVKNLAKQFPDWTFSAEYGVPRP